MVEMKDSGFDWIGKIPKSAVVSRMKFEANIILGKMVQPQQKTDDETLERYLCSANIKWEGVDTSVEKQMWFSDFEKELYKLQKDDILVTEGGSIGVSCIYNNEFAPCYFQNSVMCVRALPSKSASRFLYYWMHFAVSSGYVESVCNKATITHYPKMKLSNTPIICYPLDVQESIASYLDARCSKIDGAVAQRKAIIQKLKEYKSAVITKAVTKGLNPEAEMKDSGIDWIGQIPKDWIVKRIKFIANTGSGTTPNSKTPEYYENGVLNWIQSGDLYNKVYINSVSKKITELATKECRLTYYQAPFIVIAMYGASIGNVSISLINGYTNQACCVVIPKYCDNVKFLYYILSVAKTNLIAGSMGGTQPNISQETIRELRIPIPQIQEQQEIADYLDSQCAKIDEAIAKQEQAVTKLEEYRKSIIYHAVTGKIDCWDI